MYYCVMYAPDGEAKSFHAKSVRGAKMQATQAGFNRVAVKIAPGLYRFLAQTGNVHDHRKKWVDVESDPFYEAVNEAREKRGLRLVAIPVA